MRGVSGCGGHGGPEFGERPRGGGMGVEGEELGMWWGWGMRSVGGVLGWSGHGGSEFGGRPRAGGMGVDGEALGIRGGGRGECVEG